ncbi:MAG: HlyD family efflux transporter periplasmic adaptor subunit [Chloroflexi bacterium]|nr:HlyD family efflux transporter periplasmic adaptor subunit [Chloroflexota bacterium]
MAPFTGVITAVYANVGEATSGILLEIVDNNSLEVRLAVDEVDIGDIAPTSLPPLPWNRGLMLK